LQARRSTTRQAIEIAGLTKSYGDNAVLKGVDLRRLDRLDQPRHARTGRACENRWWTDALR
jgi:hypothetical protein